jgi:hypothetical protein
VIIQDRSASRHRFVRLGLSSGHALELSPKHFAIADGVARVATEVRPGAKMTVVHADGSRAEAAVVSVELVYREGLFAPFTETGTIVVDGVVASSYSRNIGGAMRLLSDAALEPLLHALHFPVQ